MFGLWLQSSVWVRQAAACLSLFILLSPGDIGAQGTSVLTLLSTEGRGLKIGGEVRGALPAIVGTPVERPPRIDGRDSSGACNPESASEPICNQGYRGTSIPHPDGNDGGLRGPPSTSSRLDCVRRGRAIEPERSRGPMGDSNYEVRLKTTGRNDRCLCGSGKKYKKCHLAEDEGTRAATLKVLEAEDMARPEAVKDAEGEADTKGSDKRTRSTKRQKKESGSKGRASDSKPKNIPRRGAV